MTCERCAELEERIAWLEGELGLRGADEIEAAIRAAVRASHGTHNGRGQAARVVAALYAANGRLMTLLQLLEALPPRDGRDDERVVKNVAVWIYVARQAFGRDAIQNIWGKGYRLTPAGMARVAAILNPALAVEAA